MRVEAISGLVWLVLQRVKEAMAVLRAALDVVSDLTCSLLEVHFVSIHVLISLPFVELVCLLLTCVMIIVISDSFLCLCGALGFL